MPVIESKARTSRKRTKIGPNLFERDGRFQVIKEIGGKQVCVTLKARTRTAAREEALRVLSELSAKGVHGIGDRTMTVEQLAESFLAHEEGPLGRLAERTLDVRKHMLCKYVVPTLGPRTKAVEVNAVHLRRLIDKLRAQGLAGATVRSVLSSASGMFRHGVRDLGALPRNPVRDLERGDLPSARRQTEPRYLSIEEVERLLGKLGDEFRPVAASCFYGALRVSEALALKWSDIDFDARKIAVPGTKSDAAKATIPLLRQLADELRAHRERQGRRGFDRIAQDALVFQTMNGLSPGRRNVLRAVNGAAKNAGLVPEGAEPVGCHDLRHSFAAYALGGGLSLLETSHVLRHANPQVTATVYAGLTDAAVSALGDKLAAIGGAS